MRRFIPTQSGRNQATVDFGKIIGRKCPFLFQCQTVGIHNDMEQNIRKPAFILGTRNRTQAFILQVSTNKKCPCLTFEKAEWENVRKVGHPTHQKLTNHNKEIEMIQHQASLRAYALSSWCIFCCDMWLIYLRNLQELALLIRFEPATIQTISLPERVEWRMSGKGRKTQPTQLTQSPASLMPRDLPIQNLEQAIGERMCPKPCGSMMLPSYAT